MKNSLYFFIVLLNTVLLFSHTALSFAGLIGITYNSETQNNEVRTIDPATGGSSLLNSFNFDSGWNINTFTIDLSSNRFYAISSNPTLYEFDLITGDILSTHPTATQMSSLGLRNDGLLIGITYNSETQNNEVRTIDPATGGSSLLNSFNFDSGWNINTFTIDLSSNRFYAISSNPTLYEFDLITGDILSTHPTATQMSSLGLRNDGLLIGITYNSETQNNEVRTIDPATGGSSLLNSFNFDSGWNINTFTIDLSSNRFYAISSNPTLYEFDLITGDILSTHPTATQMSSLGSYNVPVVNVPVILVHGWRGAPEDWSSLRGKLDAEGILYFIYDYYPGLDHPWKYARKLRRWIDKLKSDTGYTGKFDLVCHSMGAMVSRLYMEKLKGDKNIRQWIGIAPVNHGAGIADKFSWLMSTLNKLFFFYPGYIKGSEPAVKAMKTKSDVLANLNYDIPHFDINIWKTVPETLISELPYKVLVGWNSAGDHLFSPPSAGKTIVVKKDDKGKLYDYRTFQGDGVVPIYSSELMGVPTDCFKGAAHTTITHDSRVIERVIDYLRNPILSSADEYDCPSEDLEDDHYVTGTGNRGILYQGIPKDIEIPLDSSVGKTIVMITWPGSDLDLTMTSPSGTVLEPGVYPVADYWKGGDSIWYTIDSPEVGIWNARINAIEVPVEGEPYTLMTFHSSALTVELTTAEGKYSYDPGDNVNFVATLTEDDMPIVGASVTALVHLPNESVDELVLYDDGSHGDAIADDGNYTNIYSLLMLGYYEVTVFARGETSDAFERMSFLTLEVFLPGDFYADFAVDGSDLSVFAESFGLSRGDLKYNPAADFNDDDTIDEDDLAIFALYFGKTDCPSCP